PRVLQGGWFALTDQPAGALGEVELIGHGERRGRLDGPAAVAPERRRDGARLLIYTQDGLGLGHLRRASGGGQEVLRVGAHGSVLTASDSPLGSLMRDVPHHDYLKLPSIVKAGPGDWRSLSLPMHIAELRAMRSRLILEAASAFAPDVV